MSTHSQILRFGSLSLTSAALVMGGVLVGAFAPAWLGWGDNANYSDAAARTREPPPPPPAVKELVAATMEMPGPPPTFGDPDASYEDIVVDVRRDGSVRVYGEQIEIPALRDLLGTQLEDHVNTLVTIRPDDDCPFRHIQPVIAACEKMGVPHHMVSNPGASISWLDQPPTFAFAAGA